MKTRQSPLWIFLGLALLIHAGGLAFFMPRFKPFEIRLSEQAASLSVSLPAIKVTPRKPAPTKKNERIDPVTKPKNQPEPSRPRIARSTPELASKKVHGEKTSRTKTAPAHSKPAENQTHSAARPDRKEKTLAKKPSAEPALNRARVLTRLREDLAQYFYYPRLARRHNMQGTVTLGFGISQQGRIQNIHVVHSSGHAILDMAAEDAMAKLQGLGWIKNRWQQEYANLELPVKYRLMEN